MVEGLASRSPLGRLLPALYQDDDFVLRFTAALDEVVASALWTLDDLDAYLDPWLTPPDFLDWLAGWFGVDLDRTWPEQRSRAMVADVADLYRWRGTARSIIHLVEIHTGVTPELSESGGVSWSPTPGGKIPGEPEPWLIVRIATPEPGAVDLDRLERVLRDAIPAEVVLHLEVARR
jgi:phage tail-like protein